MATELETAQTDQARASIEHIRASVTHMEAEQVKWRRDGRRETIRIVAYCLLVAAGLLVAGATVWEQIRPTAPNAGVVGPGTNG